MMKCVSLLTKTLYKKDRKGNVSTFNLPVLTIFISDEDYIKIRFGLQNQFDISIFKFNLTPYISEMPRVLFVDHELWLSENETGWRLASSIKRDAYIN